MAERTSYREAFQRGELDLICVTTGAGGVGITLTRSDCAVFLQRPWSLVEATQSEDRLHRIGAGHDSIDVIDVIAKNTIDSRVRQVLKTRAGQLSDFVKDPRIVAEILGGASVTKLRKVA
jgi:SNF2 family DNA or RNA helicase